MAGVLRRCFVLQRPRLTYPDVVNSEASDRHKKSA